MTLNAHCKKEVAFQRFIILSTRTSSGLPNLRVQTKSTDRQTGWTTKFMCTTRGSMKMLFLIQSAKLFFGSVPSSKKFLGS